MRDLPDWRMYIDGKWVHALQGGTFAVANPATGEDMARVPAAGRADTASAVEAAAQSFPAWAARTGKERAEYLLELARALRQGSEEVAVLLTREQGKPLAESRAEVATAAEYFQWFAEEGRRVYGEIPPTWHSRKRLMVLKQPVGVTAAITPWNFPLVTAARKVAPALAAGCTVVLKPAEQTPLTSLLLAQMAEATELPAGVLNVVTSDQPEPVGEELLEHPAVRKITFTGSNAVGRLLMRGAAGRTKSLALELGGNAPFIVFADADLGRAVEGALACKFRNAGQTCICANRIYVQEGIVAEFTARFVERVRRMVVGEGMTPGVQIGPIIDAAGFQKVQGHVQDAVDRGARVLCGGRPCADLPGGFFYAPTVLDQITVDMRVVREETFGPVAPLLSFRAEAELLESVNDTPYGLAGYVYTRDLERAWRMAEQMQYGVIGINDPVPSTPQAPFGGIKESGFGREGGRQGLEAFLEEKLVSVFL